MRDYIGVVVATYNGEKYIEQQLKSIINQTIQPNMIVVSDGKSSDKTVKICNDVLCKSGIPHKIFTSDKQLSVTENFNKALEECDCDYIFFADQDDWWYPNKVEIMIDSMKKYDACLAFSNAEITDKNLNPRNIDLWTSIRYQNTADIKVYPKNDDSFIQELIKHNIVTGMTMCITAGFRAHVLPLFDGVIHDKWISFLAAYYGPVVAVNKNLVLYRQHGDNAVGTDRSLKRSLANKKKYETKLNNWLLMIQKCFEKISDVQRSEPVDLEEYIGFLNKRVNYIQKKRNLFFVLTFIPEYKKFVLNPVEIFIKDIIARVL